MMWAVWMEVWVVGLVVAMMLLVGVNVLDMVIGLCSALRVCLRRTSEADLVRIVQCRKTITEVIYPT